MGLIGVAIIIAQWLLLTERSQAFAVLPTVPSSGTPTYPSRSAFPMASSGEAESQGPPTATDILARARKAAGLPVEDDEPDAPKLFEDDLLVDMQESLLKLEKRVNKGPGALSLLEVDEFEAATQRILVEMKEKLGATASTATPHYPMPGMLETQMAYDAHGIADEVTDTSDDEAPEFDGRSGFGLARGTRNTYVIDGMDEMTPEEYRNALQQSVIDRQSKRKDGTQGVVGNRAALQYLDTLGWGGASSNWKKNEKGDEEDDQETELKSNAV